MTELLSNNINKYSIDDSKFSDKYLFNPISDTLLGPLRYIGITPNMVTYFSFIFTLISCYFLIFNNNYSILFYFLGYLFDCIDGRMARKYEMTSIYGVMIDQVTDIVSNFFIFTILVVKEIYMSKSLLKKFFKIISIINLTNNLTINFSINEALDSMKKTDHDNFYQNNINKIIRFNGDSEYPILFKIYKKINTYIYFSYRKFFENNYNELFDDRLNFLLDKKNFYDIFCPGNYCLNMCIFLYYSNSS